MFCTGSYKSGQITYCFSEYYNRRHQPRAATFTNAYIVEFGNHRDSYRDSQNRIGMRKLCEEKRANAEGVSCVYFQYFPDGTHRVFLNTRIAVPPKFWDRHKQKIKDSLPSAYGDHQKLNDEIVRQYRLAEDLIQLAKSSGVENPGLFVKENSVRNSALTS